MLEDSELSIKRGNKKLLQKWRLNRSIDHNHKLYNTKKNKVNKMIKKGKVKVYTKKNNGGGGPKHYSNRRTTIKQWKIEVIIIIERNNEQVKVC